MTKPSPTETQPGASFAGEVAAGVVRPAAPAARPKSENLYWPRGLLKDIGFCILIATALTAIMLPSWGMEWGILTRALLFNSVVSLAIGFTVSALYRFAFPYVTGRFDGRVARVLTHAGIVSVAAFGGGELALRVLQLFGFPAAQMRSGVFQIGLVVVVIVTALTFTYEKLKQHAREVELREQEARQMALRAQLEALQARTDPHFLFNTLNTVAGLIEEDPRSAERMLERLSGVFRYALSGSRQAWVRLEEELRAVRDYLDVEQIRFGDRLAVTLEIEPGSDTVLVPPLILQPLVENAVLHGVAPRTEGGKVDIEARLRDSTLVLSVRDDGPGPGRSAHRGSGSALENLRERLRLVYGDRASLESGAGSGSGYSVTMRLPVGESGS